MEDILNASLAGGVAIGAPAGLLVNPAGSLGVGLFAGIVSAFGFIYLSPYLLKTIGLYDTCGVHNLHGIPGLIGGIVSAIVISVYSSTSIDSTLASNLPFYNSTFQGRDFQTQAWYQIYGTLSSLLIAIISGIIAGSFITMGYQH